MEATDQMRDDDEAWLQEEMAKDARYWEQKHAIDDFGRYLATGNARFAWRAYHGFRRAGGSIPEALLEVFDRWANSLGSTDDDRSTLRALELGGDRKRHLGAKRVAPFERDTVIAAMVVDIMEQRKVSAAKAMAILVRGNPAGGWLSEPAVRKAYYAARKAIPLIKTTRPS